jgi:hypothetical protein
VRKMSFFGAGNRETCFAEEYSGSQTEETTNVSENRASNQSILNWKFMNFGGDELKK